MSAARKILISFLKSPYFILQIFTTHGGFKRNPILGSIFLNCFGLHVVRVCIAHLVYKLRYFYVFRMLTKEQRSFFNQNGYLKIDNIFSDETLSLLLKDMHTYNSHGYYFIEGDTKTWNAPVSRNNMKSLQGFRKIFSEKLLFKAMQFSIRKYMSAPIVIQQIQQGEISRSANDPQYWFHSDTFFPVMKMWVFLEHVNEENGPFEYIPRSHKLTWKRLKWEYRRSVCHKQRNKTTPGDQAPRYTDDDFEKLSISADDVVQFKVEPNTLVIANTYGIHRRVRATRDYANRLQLFSSLRPNPYNFLPGLGIKIHNLLNSKLMNFLVSRYSSYLSSGLKIRNGRGKLFDQDGIRKILTENDE